MTTQQAYRALMAVEIEHRKPTAAELAGMSNEIARLLKKRRNEREEILLGRYLAAGKGKVT